MNDFYLPSSVLPVKPTKQERSSSSPSDGSYVPIALSNGNVVYVSPSNLVERDHKEKERRQKFFDTWTTDLYKALRPNNPAPRDLASMGSAFTMNPYTRSGSTFGLVDKPRYDPAFRFLREMSDASMIDSLIIGIRLAQVRAASRRSPNPKRILGWRVRHKDADSPNFANTEDVQRRCDEMERLISMGMNQIWHPFGFRSIQNMLVEDELVLDRRVIIRDKLDSKGRPHGYHLVAPETVKPRLIVVMDEMNKIAAETGYSLDQAMARMDLIEAATDRVSMQSGVDLTDKMYVQEIDNRIIGAWTADECIVDVINPTTQLDRWGYGRSMLQKSLWWSLAFMNVAQYNADIFKQNYPEAIMFLYGDVNPTGLEEFKKQILQASPPGNNMRLPIIPGNEDMKAEIQKLRETPREMMFTQWLKMITAYKCACFRMNPELVNFDLVRDSENTLFQQGNNEERVVLAHEEGFDSILDGVADLINRAIVWLWYDDLEFGYVGRRALTEMQQVQVNTQKLGYATLEEVRAADGELGPVTGPDAEYANRILNPALINARSTEHQMQLADAQFELQKDQAEMAMQAQEQAGAGTPEQGAGGSDANPGAKEAPPSAGGRNHRDPGQTPPKARKRQ